MGPGDLAQVLCHLPPTLEVDANLLVGFETSDDAGVYRVAPGIALVQTVDFFTPIVDDPYDFGAIAAANALSDIYAMGARPLTVLNLVAFPVGTLDLSVLADILRGGADKIAESGARLLGGHTIDDLEPKYGLSVTGIVHPDRIFRNSTCRPGDVLVLTKPVGMGIVATAIKRGLASPDLIKRATAIMSSLNKAASEAMIAAGASACTDITGFGLAGHALEMARASKVSLSIGMSSVPVVPEAYEFARKGVAPGGTRANLSYFSQWIEFSDEIEDHEKMVAADAMTSGGLLIAVSPDNTGDLLSRLEDAGVTAAVIGKAIPGDGRLRIVRAMTG
jgi:selenide,water dikinase